MPTRRRWPRGRPETPWPSPPLPSPLPARRWPGASSTRHRARNDATTSLLGPEDASLVGRLTGVRGLGSLLRGQPPGHPVLAEELARMHRRYRSVAAHERVGGAIPVATPADAFGVRRAKGVLLGHRGRSRSQQREQRDQGCNEDGADHTEDVVAFVDRLVVHLSSPLGTDDSAIFDAIAARALMGIKAPSARTGSSAPAR